jgi:hypothetical protein
MAPSLNDISQFADTVLEVEHNEYEVHGTFDALLDIWNGVLVTKLDHSVDTLLSGLNKDSVLDSAAITKELNVKGGLSNAITNIVDNLWSKALYWGLKDGESEFMAPASPLDFTSSNSLGYVEFAKNRTKGDIKKDITSSGREFRAAVKNVNLSEELYGRLIEQRNEIYDSPVQDEERISLLLDNIGYLETDLRELRLTQQEAQLKQIRFQAELSEHNARLAQEKAAKELAAANPQSKRADPAIRKAEAERQARLLEENRQRNEALKQEQEYADAVRNRRELKVPSYLKAKNRQAKANAAQINSYDKAFKRVIATDAREEFNTIDNVYTALNRKSEFSNVYLDKRKASVSKFLSDGVQEGLREEVAEYIRQQDPTYAAQGIMKGIKSSAGSVLSNERGPREAIVREQLATAFRRSSPTSTLKNPVYGSDQKNRLLTTKAAQTDLFREINAALPTPLTQEEKTSLTASLTRAQKRGNLEDTLKSTIRKYRVGETSGYSYVNNLMANGKETYSYENAYQLNSKITETRDGQQAARNRVQPIYDRYKVRDYNGLLGRLTEEEDGTIDQVTDHFTGVSPEPETIRRDLLRFDTRITNLKTPGVNETRPEKGRRLGDLERLLREEMGFKPELGTSPEDRRARLQAVGEAQGFLRTDIERADRLGAVQNDVDEHERIIRSDEEGGENTTETNPKYRDLRAQIKENALEVSEKSRRLTQLKTRAATFPKGSPERKAAVEEVKGLERERTTQRDRVRDLKKELVPETRYLQGLETVQRTQQRDYGKLQTDMGAKATTEDIQTGVTNYDQDLDKQSRALDKAKVAKNDPRRAEIERKRIILEKYKAKKYKVTPRSEDTVVLSSDELKEVQRTNPDIAHKNGRVSWEDLKHARDSNRNSAGGSSEAYAATLISTEIAAAYNLGRLQAYMSKGVQYVQYTSADDPVVSVFCRSLDKVIFRITDFAQIGMRPLADGESLPQSYIGRQPYPKTRIPHFAPPNSELVARNAEGVGIWCPPSHLNCRSYLKPIYKKEDREKEEKINKKQMSAAKVSKKDQALILKRLQAGQLTEAEAARLLGQQTPNRTRLEKMSKWLLKRKQKELRLKINEILGEEVDLSNVNEVNKILNIEGLQDSLSEKEYAQLTELRGDSRNQIIDTLFAAERKFKKVVNNKTVDRIGFLTSMVTDAGVFMQKYLDKKTQAEIKKDPSQMDTIISAAILGGAGALGMGGALYFLSKSNLMNELDEYVQDNIPELLSMGAEGLTLGKDKVKAVISELKTSLPPSMVKLLEGRNIPFLPEPALLESLETRQSSMLEVINSGVSSQDFETLGQYVSNYGADDLPPVVIKTKVVEALNKELTSVGRELVDELNASYQRVFTNSAGPVDLANIQRVDTDFAIGYRVFLDKGSPTMISKKTLAGEVPNLANIRQQAEQYVNAIDDLLKTTTSSNPGYSDLVANRRIMAEVIRNTDLEKNLAKRPKGTLTQVAGKLNRISKNENSVRETLDRFNSEYFLAEQEVRQKVTVLENYKPSTLALTSIADNPTLLLELREQSLRKLADIVKVSEYAPTISPSKITQLGNYAQQLSQYGYEMNVTGIVEDLSGRYLDKVTQYSEELRSLVEEINKLLGS